MAAGGVRGELEVGFDGETGAFTVRESESGRTWKSLGDVKLPRGVDVSWKTEGNELVVEMSASAGMAVSPYVEYPAPFGAERGERVLLPQGNGMAYPVEMKDICDGAERVFSYPGRDMELGCFGVYGEKKTAEGGLEPGSGYLAIYETPEDSGVRNPVRSNGLRQPTAVWRGEKGKWGYNRRIRYVFGAKMGPMEMALRYREVMKERGYWKPFGEKIAEADPVRAERMRRMAGTPNVWYWAVEGDKPGFAKELKALGMENVLIQFATRMDLNVWVTPEEIRQVAAVPGMLPGEYDIYKDFMDPANLPLIDCVRPHWPTGVWENCDYVMDSRGKPVRGWQVNKKGTTDAKNRIGCATLCEARAWKYAKERVGRAMTEAPHAARLFDVTGGSLGECWNPRHPLVKRESKVARIEFFRNLGETFRILVGTEDGSEVFVPTCDYFEGTMSAPDYYRVDGGRYMWKVYEDVPAKVAFGMDPALRVPFFDMVFHGCVNLYWYWCDYNSKFPKLWRRKDLFNFVTGEPPMYLFTPETFAKQKGRVAESYRVATMTAKATFGEAMTGYRWLTADRMVQQSEFANGVRATVNFGDKPYRAADGHVIEPMGYRFEHAKR